MKNKITKRSLCEKFLWKREYELNEAFLNDLINSNRNLSEACLNKLSELITSLITSFLADLSPNEQINNLKKIREIAYSSYDSKKVRSLSDMEHKLYAFLHCSEFPKFMQSQFRKHGLEEYAPEDYQDAIKTIFDDRLLLIGNYVKNAYTNLEKYTQDPKEKGSWQDKIKAEGSKKNVSFA